MNDFLKDLPQYAALITASIAVSIFIAKEAIEFFRRKKEKRNSEYAIDRVASMQVMRMLLHACFILELKEKIKKNGNNKSKLTVNDGLKFIANETDIVSRLPLDMTYFSYEVMINVAKVDNSKFTLYANINHTSVRLENIVDCIKSSIKEYKEVIFYLDDEEIMDTIDKVIRTAERLNHVMIKNDEYEKIMKRVKQVKDNLI
ncbi:hypothetical protein [Providencia alcalifaciens]|uniref:hypothetical protein n=1 Tax=Providencia alcalifaciens TaxID=126385 RepID=UPI0003E23B27|nr:hypothetical protein [Providencia alcalifaciens]ETT00058.1 hypothetical protein HMPREF1568_0473 [Providencia alcalifaciens PAL-3]EUD00764.1 hypothetical protein HMPREF1566_3062 [Providencia alcalifaciens PAL-1]